MCEEEKKQRAVSPERLSGHKLVNYLIANPEARGNFKYQSLLSCMWRNLLIAQPGFVDVADFDKIHHHDIYKILLEQPQLAPYFDFSKLWDGENRCLFLKRPEIATPETTAFISGHTWSEILKVHTHLGTLCPWDELQPYQVSNVVRRNGDCLKFFKLEHISSVKDIYWVLFNCYLREVPDCQEGFEQNIHDAASYLIFKRIDRTNSKKFLKKQFCREKWEFVEQVCAISPEDVLDVYNKKYIHFFMTLEASDTLFENLLHLFDLRTKDPAGNSFLMAALVRGLVCEDMSRYSFLLAQGLDPDEKNIAGFSCNDLRKHLEVIKAKEEAAAMARIERVRQRRKDAKKGNGNVY